MNDCYRSVSEGKENKVLDDIFEELTKYSQFHFQTEERYFDEFHYEGAAEHKEAHRILWRDIEALKEKNRGDDEAKLLF